MSNSFSKIWIIVIALVIISGGILSWHYCWAQNKEVGAPEKIPKERVNITTDKTGYEQGDAVSIVIQNNLNKSIWYWDHRGQVIPLVGIQIFKDEEWKSVEKKSACACKANCLTYAAGWVELKPKAAITDTWDLKEDCLGKNIIPGKYRICFSYDLDSTGQNKEENFFRVYSKGFIIKAKAEKDKTAKCSPVDPPDYEVVRGRSLEFFVDLNGDGKGEFVRVYHERTDKEERILPIMVKIFSRGSGSLKEEFSYKTGFGDSGLKCNEVGLAQVMENLWGDGRKVVMVQGVSTAYGSGSTQQLYFFTWQNGKYTVIEGPRYGWSQGAPSGYMFAGGKAKGTKIILALPFEGEYLSSHSYQFVIYNWDGAKYIGTKEGTTKNKYGWAWWEKDDRDFIEQIIQTEPQVLELAKEGSSR